MTARLAKTRVPAEPSELDAMLLASVPHMMGIVEPDDDDIFHVYDNPASCRYFGLAPGSTAGRWARRELGAPADVVERWLAAYRESARMGAPVRFEYTRAGQTFSVTVFPLSSYEGRARFGYACEDVSELARERDRALRRFEAAARALVGIVYEWDLETDAVWRSGGIETLTGFRDDEVPGGRGWFGLVHPDDRTRLESLYASARTGPETQLQNEYRVRRRDGSYATVLDSQSLIRDGEGKLVRVVGTTIDVSERAEREAELQRAREQAEQASRFAELFVAMVSHDLRNPVSAVLTAAALLERTKLDERSRALAARIHSSGQRMGRRIEQLLDISRIRNGEPLSVLRTQVDLRELVSRIADELASARGCDVRIEGDDVVGHWDPDRLGQVFSNLLGNAVQHGVGGRVDVSIRSLEGRAVVSVHNDGAIPPDVLPEMFDPFRSGRQAGRNSKGLGLGLYITREIVHLLEGTIDVQSNEQDGTTFTVSLPHA